MKNENSQDEKEYSLEEIEAMRKEQIQEFDKQIDFFRKQLELESLHQQIAEARLKTYVARMQLAHMMAPVPEDEKDSPEKDNVNTRKLKTKR